MQDPRGYSEGLTGWRRRAHLAHLNAFEATPAILAGVVIVELAAAPRLHVDALALAFVAFRALHAALYIADRPMLRSHAWRLGILCVIASSSMRRSTGSEPGRPDGHARRPGALVWLHRGSGAVLFGLGASLAFERQR